MKHRLLQKWFVISLILLSSHAISQNPDDLIIVKPEEIDDVLTNPGIGFMTFQRFNGDKLNRADGWTEGFPIEYQEEVKDLTNDRYPPTTIAYWRVYWKFVQPEKNVCRWDMFDTALEFARKRGQTLLIRIAPYGTGEDKDVPFWYREMVGPQRDWKYNNPVNKWAVDPEDPRYAEYFGGFIRALGDRYDGHPDLEAVDLSIVGAWGEGAGSELLSRVAREALVDAYTESFVKTPLITLLMDEETNKYANSKISTGWRVDCIGDLGFWADEQNGWTHMNDFYPREIINYGVDESWKESPLSFEICGTFLNWRDRQGYGREEVKYIFDESLKWHISSFNAKSSPVPEEWDDLVDEWLKKMGYRFVLRRFTYPPEVIQNGKLPFTSWWVNKGVAPCYKDFIPALRLKADGHEALMIFPECVLKKWLPGDIVFDDFAFIPPDLPPGIYDLQIGITDRLHHTPRINLAIEGKDEEGWYLLGKIEVKGRN